MPISGPAKPVFNFHEETTKMCGCTSKGAYSGFISSPGRSPGRAIVLPPASESASALAKSLTLKFFM